MEDHYPALTRFATLCDIMAWLSVISGLIGAGLGIYFMDARALFPAWPLPTLILSVLSGIFWYITFKALAEFAELSAQQGNALNEAIRILSRLEKRDGKSS